MELNSVSTPIGELVLRGEQKWTRLHFLLRWIAFASWKGETDARGSTCRNNHCPHISESLEDYIRLSNSQQKLLHGLISLRDPFRTQWPHWRGNQQLFSHQMSALDPMITNRNEPPDFSVSFFRKLFFCNNRIHSQFPPFSGKPPRI